MTPGGIRTRDLSFQRRCNSDLHHGPWRELAGNGRCCCRSEEHTQPRHFCRRDSNPRLRTATAVRRFYRSNRHLHHRPAEACASAVERHAGEQAISVSVTATQLRSLWKRNCAGPRASPRGAASRCVRQRRDSNPLFPWREVSEIFTTSVGLAASGGKPNCKNSSRRSSGAATANPLGVRSAIGIRLAPRSLRQAPRAWARACRREPRDPGLPFRLAPGCFDEPVSDNKKPSGAAGSGGSE
jgi:hypothetical protein